jgi:pimeloyl-ACP methyl ester carboxylesterase
MSYKNLSVKGINIAWQEKNPEENTTIFFIHGNSNSSGLWRKQFDSPVFAGYRLVAFDLPAHGESDAAPDPGKDYTGQELGALMADAVSKIANDRPYIIAGLSLGTNIVAEMLAFHLSPSGIILASPDVMGGAYTLDKAILPGADTSVLFMDNAPADAVSQYTHLASLSTDPADHQLLFDDYFRVKAPFRSELLKTAINGRFSDEIALLQITGIPVLVIFGKDETMLNINYLEEAPFPVWKNTFFKLPGASHFVNLDQPGSFNELVASYIKERIKDIH